MWYTWGMARSCTRSARQAAVVLAAALLLPACPLPEPPAAKTWKLTTNAIGEGTVSRDPQLVAYPDGTAVTLNANPGPDWAFREWSGDAAGHGNPVTLAMTSDRSVTATFYELVSRGATAASCRLSGTPCAGERWTARWGGADSTCTVESGQALGDVAAELAVLLDGRVGACAGAEGSTFGLVDLSGAPIVLEVIVEAAGSASVDESSDGTAVITFGGTLSEGDVWTLVVNGQPVSRTVVPNDSLADVAASLASQLEALPGYLCRADNAVMVLCAIPGGALVVTATLPTGCSANVSCGQATTKRVFLSGMVNPADAWSVQLEGAAAEHHAVVGDTVSSVAAVLASALGGAPGFIVESEGAVIAVVKGTGGTFELSAAVTPTGSGTVDTATPTAALLVPAGDVVPGETWTLRLGGVDYPYVVQAGDTASSLASALAGLVDAAGWVISSSESSTISVESLSGETLEVSLEVAVP